MRHWTKLTKPKPSTKPHSLCAWTLPNMHKVPMLVLYPLLYNPSRPLYSYLTIVRLLSSSSLQVFAFLSFDQRNWKKKMCGSNSNVSEAGRTMIIGSTGFIGRFVAEASLDFGRPTYLLVQSRPTSPSKASIIKSLQERGAIIIHVILLFIHFFRVKLSQLFFFFQVVFNFTI